MKRLSELVTGMLFLAVMASTGAAQVIPDGSYFGQPRPGFLPVVFAPGVISLPGRFEYCLTFSPGMDECVFGSTNPVWDGFNLWYTRMDSDSSWSAPIPAPFQGTGDALFPFWAADGHDIHFVSSRPSYPPTRIWRSSRDGDGWSEPLALEAPVYSGSNEWGSSLTADGTLYFSSDRAGGLGEGDIYRTVALPGGGTAVESLGAAINSAQNDGSACIARDGSYLIFESGRPGGRGQGDLYISFNDHGAWSAPRNLGPEINTSWIEDGPSVSPDGKYLFFNRRQAWYTATQTEIWWVDARAVFEPGASDVKEPAGSMEGRVILRNDPNPFGASTTITYSTPATGRAEIRVFDVLGREVQSLVSESAAAGIHSINLGPPRGAALCAGIYYCCLQVGDRRLKTIKMVAVR